MLKFVHTFRGALVILLSLLITIQLSANTIKIRQAPDKGEGFTDDFNVMLEGREPDVNFLSSALSYSSGHVDLPPWSDSYWPIYRGLIATRFQAPNLPNTKNWQVHHQFYRSHPASQYINNNRIDQLSPAEKYDLLVGDTNWTITRYMWDKGQKSYNQFGFVPSWTGICHGWAAATQIGIPQPQKQVTMVDPKFGRAIEFSQFDIQALVSYLWSRPHGEDLFTGRRCRTENPKKDGKKVLDPTCFDVNPMTWHLAILNRVGKHKKSLVMDTSGGAEVWNYAVDSYKVKYFNPKTNEFTFNVKDAIIKRKDFPNDPFSKYRYEGATHLVGVMMDAYHPGAVVPHGGIPKHQLLERKRFIYDLELDDNLDVVGGEWYSKDHPDFMWLYPEKYNPFLNENSDLLTDVDTYSPQLTSDEISAAQHHAKRGLVAPEVVYKILHRSL